MKNLIIKSLAFILFIFTGCNNNSGTEVKFVKLTADGVLWEDDGTSYINKSLSTLNVSGSTGTGILTVYVKNVSGLGTYSLTTNDGATQLTWQDVTGTPTTYSIKSSRPESHGTITVTKVNAGTSALDYVEGTFSGVAYNSATDSVVITNGEFAYSK